MPRVAIITDSASDLSPEDAASHEVTVIPLMVTFGSTEYRTGVDIDRPYTPPPATAPRMGWLAFLFFVWLGSVVGYAAVGMR